MAVVGPVGSGKSSLINGIIGEVDTEKGTMVTSTKRMSYASQIPFILNSTFRENILFGLPYDEQLYDEIIEACCLRPDIQQLGPALDLTEIGERGVTLSGGQKQRVSLARAAYAQPDLILCDDPLSALDAGTGRKIFDRLFTSRDSPIASSAVVLVTHAAHFLNRVDSILLLVNGNMKFHGTWKQLTEFVSSDAEAVMAVDSIRSAVQETSDDEGEEYHVQQEEKGESLGSVSLEKANAGAGVLMTAETREHGLSSLKTWLLWFKNAGGLPFLSTQIFLLFLDRFFYVATEFWLAFWTSAAYAPGEFFGREFPAQTDGRTAQAQYIGFYILILCLSLLGTFSRSQWAVTGGARCAKSVFYSMLVKVLGAPMSYFESTPMGRIINRFTYDTEVVDVTLSEAMSVLMISCSWFCAGVIVQAIIIPYMLAALVPVMALYVLLLLHYRKSGADLQRIDALTRSPIQAMLAEGLDGSATIKVFKKRSHFLSKFQDSLDINSSSVLNFISAQRWLGLRIEMLGCVIVLVATVLVVTLNDTLRLEPGIVGLLIIWSSNFTITLGFMMDYFGETEAAITSIERVTGMTTIPQEAAMDTDPLVNLPHSWPDRGALQFENVCIRYRKGLPLALDQLSFQVDAGKRCGVVGRTGAGKSTLTVGLFRLVEAEAGRIIIDNIDIKTLGLSDLRSRLSIIPQDPFLFAGTLRECIDPFGQATDDDVIEALRTVRLRGSSGEASQVLETRVEEGGSNYSVGERQLLCLARALLAKPKVLVMDEATASVDNETDSFIQKMLRTRFSETTLLTVAHRLNTIMDYDYILVMDKGRAVEFGPPIELLESEGVFTELVNATGEESAAALRKTAFESFPSTDV
jgi:ABC-type multidrug transport system fused ATPase/permease subunit